MQEIMTQAACCADCSEAACMRACPQQVDLQRIFRYIAAQADQPLTWKRDPAKAEVAAQEAIGESFA